jgi:hypothetical protein
MNDELSRRRRVIPFDGVNDPGPVALEGTPADSRRIGGAAGD